MVFGNRIIFQTFFTQTNPISMHKVVSRVMIPRRTYKYAQYIFKTTLNYDDRAWDNLR